VQKKTQKQEVSHFWIIIESYRKPYQ